MKDVFYERCVVNDEIRYSLFIRKMIGGKIRTIDFVNESTGTYQILKIIHTILGAFYGQVIVYDEISSDIHDLLLDTILISMIDDINGQLIITTHNSHLLETIDIKSLYVIFSDSQGNKEVKCLDKYSKVLHINNSQNIDFKQLLSSI